MQEVALLELAHKLNKKSILIDIQKEIPIMKKKIKEININQSLNKESIEKWEYQF